MQHRSAPLACGQLWQVWRAPRRHPRALFSSKCPAAQAAHARPRGNAILPEIGECRLTRQEGRSRSVRCVIAKRNQLIGGRPWERVQSKGHASLRTSPHSCSCHCTLASFCTATRNGLPRQPSLVPRRRVSARRDCGAVALRSCRRWAIRRSSCAAARGFREQSAANAIPHIVVVCADGCRKARVDQTW